MRAWSEGIAWVGGEWVCCGVGDFAVCVGGHQELLVGVWGVGAGIV